MSLRSADDRAINVVGGADPEVRGIATSALQAATDAAGTAASARLFAEQSAGLADTALSAASSAAQQAAALGQSVVAVSSAHAALVANVQRIEGLVVAAEAGVAGAERLASTLHANQEAQIADLRRTLEELALVISGALVRLTLTNTRLDTIPKRLDGRTVGNIVGRTAGSALALTDSAGGRFALVGDAINLVGDDWPIASSWTITLRETLGDDVRLSRIEITYPVAAAPSDTTPDAFAFAPATVAPNSAASSSTVLTGLNAPAPIVPAPGIGWSINGGPVQTGTGSYPVGATLGIHADAGTADIEAWLDVGGVRGGWSVNVEAPAEQDGKTLDPSIAAPVLTIGDPMARPATTAFAIAADVTAIETDTVRLQSSASPDFAAIATNDTLPLGAARMRDFAELTAAPVGARYIRARIERGNVASAWSVPVLIGTIAAPALTSAPPAPVYETFKLAAALVFDAPCYPYLEGDDRLACEIVGARPGTDFTLRWMDDASRRLSDHADFDGDGVFDIEVKAVGLNGAASVTAAPVTLSYYDTDAADVTIAPITGAAPNARVVWGPIPVADMAAGYRSPVATTADDVSTTGADGPWVAASSATVAAGESLWVRGTAPATYSTQFTETVTFGNRTETMAVVTMADPATASIVPARSAPFVQEAQGYSGASRTTPVDFEAAGMGVFVTVTNTSVGTLNVGGLMADNLGSLGNVTLWKAPVAAGNNNVTATLASGSIEHIAIVGFLARPVEVQHAAASTAYAYNRAEIALDGPIAVAPGGVGIVVGVGTANAITFTNAPLLSALTVNRSNSEALHLTIGAIPDTRNPTGTREAGGQSGLLAATFKDV